MGLFLLGVILVIFIMLFINALMMFHILVVECMRVNSIMREHLCVSQLCAQRSVSTVAVFLQIHASVSLDGADWTAPVVSGLYFQTYNYALKLI